MLVWIGFGLMRAEELKAKRQVADLAEGRLTELVRTIDEVMSSQQRSIQLQIGQASQLPDDLIQLERSQPQVRRAMWVSTRSKLLYPEAPTSNFGNEFLLYNELNLMARQRPPVPSWIRKESTDQILSGILDNAAQRASPPTNPPIASKQATLSIFSQTADNSNAFPESRWQESYFDEGLQLVVWNLRPDGSAVGCWLERARWIADVIAALPDGNPTLGDAATVLVDANGNVIYRWGDSDLQLDSSLAEVKLKEPLASWSLKYYVPANGEGALKFLHYMPWVMGIATGAIALLALGAYVTLATTHQLRLANQRVSFVGQVSHELRTPLTNIRLYAEMAQRDLSQETPAVNRIAERIAVIDSESKRLSRLISGVLEFMQGRKEQSLARRLASPDETIHQVLTQCSISLERNGISISTDLDASESVKMDSDVLEQILINLINNVEKYAASGKSLSVVSKLDRDNLIIDVRDLGPGIPARFIDRIFQPFFRLDDANTAPSGTGLGLTIARKAAKRHGGGLELVRSDLGAHFRLWIRVERETFGESRTES